MHEEKKTDLSGNVWYRGEGEGGREEERESSVRILHPFNL